MSEDQQIVQQWLRWAGLESDPSWQAVLADPEASAKIAARLRELAAVEETQAEPGAGVQAVFGHSVFNFRPLIMPVLKTIAAIGKMYSSPDEKGAHVALDAALDWLENLPDVYRGLNDDEVDVYGAVVDLDGQRKIAPSVTNPLLYPTEAGVRAWFSRSSIEGPNDGDLPKILESLVTKGAVLKEGDFYTPTFWGKKKDG